MTNQIHALCRLHPLSWSTITSRVEQISASYYLAAMFIPQRQLGSCSVTRPFPLSLHPSSPSLFLSCPVKHTVCSEKLAGVRIANFIAPPPNANTVNLGRIDVTLSSVLNATESHHFTSSDMDHYSEYFNISVPEASGPRTYSYSMYRVSPNLRA